MFKASFKGLDFGIYGLKFDRRDLKFGFGPLEEGI
jgi:hypothetical protein